MPYLVPGLRCEGHGVDGSATPAVRGEDQSPTRDVVVGHSLPRPHDLLFARLKIEVPEARIVAGAEVAREVEARSVRPPHGTVTIGQDVARGLPSRLSEPQAIALRAGRDPRAAPGQGRAIR